MSVATAALNHNIEATVGCSLNEFRLILPYVPELGPYIEDQTISEIMINGNGSLYVERRGVMERVGTGIFSPTKLLHALQRIARKAGQELNEDNPYVDARLPDGSRVAASLPPCSVGGPALSIRKFRKEYFALEKLVELGGVPGSMATTLRDALLSSQNILISGQPGSGKTTLTNALLNELDPHSDRLVMLEESAEMQVHAENVQRFECRLVEGQKPITMQHLVKNALRYRPDHLIVGELRGKEALDLLNAWNSGNGGSMTTIHANSTRMALTKLSNLALQAGGDIPHEAIQAQIGDVLQFVVQMTRRGENRYVSEVIRLEKYDVRDREFICDPIYKA